MWTLVTIVATLAGWPHDAQRIAIPTQLARCQIPAARFVAGGESQSYGFALCRDGRVLIFDSGAYAGVMLAPSVFEPMLAELVSPSVARELRELQCANVFDAWLEIDAEIEGKRVRRNVIGCGITTYAWEHVAREIFGILLPGYDPLDRYRARHGRSRR
jgi:hypothetical protein